MSSAFDSTLKTALLGLLLLFMILLRSYRQSQFDWVVS